MPERQIPWRRVAAALSGSFYVKTGVLDSYFELKAVVEGVQVKVTAKSTPYASSGGQTEVRAITEHALGATIYVVRNLGTVPLFRRFFLRDVLTGDSGFDHRWIINARREAHAQAFLGKEVRALIQSVPASMVAASYVGETTSMYYDYDVRGREVMAYTRNFETDPERMISAIRVAVALARQPKALLARWRQLAIDLGGRLEHGARFRMDGSTRIHVPVQGKRVIVSPTIVRLKRRRDRLRTRISCECSGNARQPKFHLLAGEDAAQLGEHAKLVESAMLDSGAQLLRGNGKIVHADLDGNVTHKGRIIAAANAIAVLARGTDSAAGPYR